MALGSCREALQQAADGLGQGAAIGRLWACNFTMMELPVSAYGAAAGQPVLCSGKLGVTLAVANTAHLPSRQ